MFGGIEVDGTRIQLTAADSAIFDIETVPDKALAVQVLESQYVESPLVSTKPLDDRFEDLMEAYQAKEGSTFLPLCYHRPIAICLLVCNKNLEKITLEEWTLDKECLDGAKGQDEAEAEIVKKFWRFTETFPGRMVTFNGRGFDFPVLEYRALKLGLPLVRYMEDSRKSFRHRYGRQTDLRDIMSNYGAVRMFGGLDAVSKGLGLAGKGDGVHGEDVLGMFEQGKFKEIREYCTHDVFLTYWVYIKYSILSGRIKPADGAKLIEEGCKV